MIALLQRPLRHAFLAVEGLFNRAFGDRFNPLYHLGSTSFYLFWIVGATGLVLYVFFDTSVVGAYESVQGLSDNAWRVGGVMRSLHRYASDAMVLTLLLHLVRYFAFDRLRGFRAFSWITGVALLWLVYVAGASGYMLPWDQLAQFVTQASFEWLDSVPGFDGRLIRNFIAPDSVSDRLFSLFVFIHIGVPLLMLLMMWVHVQRVPKASTQPPRVVAFSVLASLVILSLVLPVNSQGGPANLAQAPTALALDWFLLPLYPLVYVWPHSALWGLVLGATALLVALPWLLPRLANRSLRISVHPGAHQISARAGETLLDAGLRQGLSLPYDCRAGGCGLCLCTVLNGQVDHGAYQPAVLTAAMRARGQALLCCATPLGDVEIEVEPGAAQLEAGAYAQRHWRGRIAAMDLLTPEQMRLLVDWPDGVSIDFAAGQYVNIVLDDGAKRAFSFASSPLAPGPLELHVRRVPNGRFTTQVFTQMKVGDELDLEGPLGRFTLTERDQPILFVAGATGFAPVKSLLEDAFARCMQREMTLYWGVRKPSDLYLLELVEQWQREHPNFHFVPVVSDGEAGDGWSGRRGWVHEAMLADHPDLSGVEVYACGSVGMVEAAVPAFLAQGLPEQFCYSDAFTLTLPRS